MAKRTEAVERFLDTIPDYESSKTLDSGDFYLEIFEADEKGWDFFKVANYSGAKGTVEYLKNRGKKVKVVNRGKEYLIFTKSK